MILSVYDSVDEFILSHRSSIPSWSTSEFPQLTDPDQILQIKRLKAERDYDMKEVAESQKRNKNAGFKIGLSGAAGRVDASDLENGRE